MKAIQIVKHGGPDCLQPADVPDPVIRDNEALIKVHCAGINFAEVLARQGLYADAPPPPFVPGYEVAGTIEAVGSAVQGFSAGDKVCAMTNFGGYAEYVAVRPLFIRKVDPDISCLQAAAIPVNWITAYHSLFGTGPVNPGDRVLVHAAAGGTGIAAVKLLKNAGCEVFGTAGSARKREFLKNIGVDHPINYREQDFTAAVKAIAGDRGIDLVMDSIGGDYIRKGLKLLRGNGRIVTMGFASFAGKSKAALSFRLLKKFMVSPFHLMGYSNGVYGFYLTRLMIDRPDLVAHAFDKVVSLVNEGKLSPVIDSMYSFADAAEAHARIESRQSIGKVLLVND